MHFSVTAENLSLWSPGFVFNLQLLCKTTSRPTLKVLLSRAGPGDWEWVSTAGWVLLQLLLTESNCVVGKVLHSQPEDRQCPPPHFAVLCVRLWTSKDLLSPRGEATDLGSWLPACPSHVQLATGCTPHGCAVPDASNASLIQQPPGRPSPTKPPQSAHRRHQLHQSSGGFPTAHGASPALVPT